MKKQMLRKLVLVNQQNHSFIEVTKLRQKYLRYGFEKKDLNDVIKDLEKQGYIKFKRKWKTVYFNEY